MSPEDRLTPELVDYLLSLPTREQRSHFLAHAGLLDAKGLDGLLDFAERSLNEDPGKARRLAESCRALADMACAPAAVPRADYIRAAAHNINGEFDEDLRLTEAACAGYLALGMNLEALRTNVGRMDALLELGRYREALDAGRIVLDALEGESDLRITPTREQADLLAGLVYQNLGLCYEHLGRYEEALAASVQAEERYRALGMTERVGEVLDNRGAVLLFLGRGTEALEAREAAAEIFGRAGLTLSFGKALINTGQVHLQLGNYARALDAFERSRRLLETLDAHADAHLLLRDTADAYLALNLYSEALTTYREASDLFRSTGMAHDRARALWGMGSALVAQRQYEEAEEALEEAAALFEGTGNVPLLSGVMLEQAALRAVIGHRGLALSTARRALRLLAREDWPVQRAFAHLRVADLLLPAVAEAEPHLREARRLVDRLALPQLRYRLNERLGHLRRLQGRAEEARALLEATIDEVERLRGTVAQDAMRASFLRDKTAAYEDPGRDRVARGDEENVRRAFEVAERAKSRALIDLIAGASARGSESAGDPRTEDRRRTLQADLNAVYDRLLGGGGEDDVSLAKLRARAAELEQELSRLQLRASAVSQEQNPFAELPSPEDDRAWIPRDATLLAYHTVGDEVMAFVGSGKRLRVVRGLGSVARVRQLSQRLVSQ